MKTTFLPVQHADVVCPASSRQLGSMDVQNSGDTR